MLDLMEKMNLGKIILFFCCSIGNQSFAGSIISKDSSGDNNRAELKVSISEQYDSIVQGINRFSYGQALPAAQTSIGDYLKRGRNWSDIAILYYHNPRVMPADPENISTIDANANFAKLGLHSSTNPEAIPLPNLELKSEDNANSLIIKEFDRKKLIVYTDEVLSDFQENFIERKEEIWDLLFSDLGMFKRVLGVNQIKPGRFLVGLLTEIVWSESQIEIYQQTNEQNINLNSCSIELCENRSSQKAYMSSSYKGLFFILKRKNNSNLGTLDQAKKEDWVFSEAFKIDSNSEWLRELNLYLYDGSHTLSKSLDFYNFSDGDRVDDTL